MRNGQSVGAVRFIVNVYLLEGIRVNQPEGDAICSSNYTVLCLKQKEDGNNPKNCKLYHARILTGA